MTLTAADVRATTFPAASRLRRGYDADEVDAFVERIASRLETGEGLTSNDVYHVPFGKAGIGGRGYTEADVDAFLERVHAELVRLEDAWGGASASAPETDGTPDGDPGDAPDDDTDDISDDLPADGEAMAEIAVADPAEDADNAEPDPGDRTPGPDRG